MDLSSEEEILEIEVEESDEGEEDFDEISVNSLNENFYVKQSDEKNDSNQRVKDRVADRINSIFGCDISNISKVNDLNADLVKKLQYLDDKHDLNSSCAPSDLHSSYWRGELNVLLRRTRVKDCLCSRRADHEGRGKHRPKEGGVAAAGGRCEGNRQELRGRQRGDVVRAGGGEWCGAVLGVVPASGQHQHRPRPHPGNRDSHRDGGELQHSQRDQHQLEGVQGKGRLIQH